MLAPNSGSAGLHRTWRHSHLLLGLACICIKRSPMIKAMTSSSFISTKANGQRRSLRCSTVQQVAGTSPWPPAKILHLLAVAAGDISWSFMKRWTPCSYSDFMRFCSWSNFPGFPRFHTSGQTLLQQRRSSGPPEGCLRLHLRLQGLLDLLHSKVRVHA